MNVSNKVVLITGASSGIGAQLSLKLALFGAKIVVNYCHSKQAAESIVKKIIDNGGEAIAVQADVSNEHKCQHLVEQTIKRFGQLDVLINNAGTTTFVPHQELDLLTADIWQTTLATNLLGPFFMCRAALPFLQKNGGEIVMTSSIAGSTTNGSSIAYSASKAGLNSLTKTLAKSLGQYNIRVNAICPGLIDGAWGEKGWQDNWQAAKDFSLNGSAIKALSTPADIADGMISIITGSDLMTGQLVTLDSGYTL